MHVRPFVASWLAILLGGCAATPPAAAPARQPAATPAATQAAPTVSVMTLELPPDPAQEAADARPMPHDPEARLSETPLRWEDGDRSAASLLAWNDAWTPPEVAQLRGALLRRLARHGPADPVGWAFLAEHLDRLPLDGLPGALARVWAAGALGDYPEVFLRRAWRGDDGELHLWDVGERAPAPFALLLLAVDLQVDRGERTAQEVAPVIAACLGRCERSGRYTNAVALVLHALAGDLLPDDVDAPEGQHPATPACRALSTAGLLGADDASRLLATPSALEETW